MSFETEDPGTEDPIPEGAQAGDPSVKPWGYWTQALHRGWNGWGLGSGTENGPTGLWQQLLGPQSQAWTQLWTLGGAGAGGL